MVQEQEGNLQITGLAGNFRTAGCMVSGGTVDTVEMNYGLLFDAA